MGTVELEVINSPKAEMLTGPTNLKEGKEENWVDYFRRRIEEGKSRSI